MKTKAWGDMYQRGLGRGWDHSAAAHFADEWMRRQICECGHAGGRHGDFGQCHAMRPDDDEPCRCDNFRLAAKP